MGRALLTLRTSTDRAKALDWVKRAPPGTRLTFQRAKRSIDQNSLMWSLLTQVAEQVEWHGLRLTADDWKDMFTASLRKARVVPGLDPGSFVLLGLHTSDMGKDEMSALIELILAFGAGRSVVFREAGVTPAELAQGRAA